MFYIIYNEWKWLLLQFDKIFRFGNMWIQSSERIRENPSLWRVFDFYVNKSLISAKFFINKFFLIFDRTPILEWIHFSIKAVGTFWMIYYFFPAHHRFYGEKIIVSVIKSSVILILNLVIITILLILFALYTYINIH